MQFVPSNTLNYVYSEKIPIVTQEINPSSTRIDTMLSPTNPSPAVDTYLFQLSKAFMKLCIKKTERFNVSVHDVLVAPTLDANNLINNAPSGKALLTRYNYWFDPFCVSKSISNFAMSWGANKLETNSTYRNPLLIEFASGFLDLEKCKQLGQVPWATTGMGQYNDNIAKNPLTRKQMAILSEVGFDALLPLAEPSYAMNSEISKMIRILNSQERVTLVGTPSFFNNTGTPIGAYQLDNGDWAPGTANTPYYGAVTGNYTFDVSEYLIDEHLYTPYQKNETQKSVKITPEQNVNFEFKYDTDYIANGLFNFNSFQSKGGSLGFNDATASSCTVVRDQNNSRITIESFEVLIPPKEGLVLKSVNWRPVAMVPNTVSVSLSALNENSQNSSVIRILDQQNSVLPQYILLGGEARLYTGLQNSTLITSGVANYNMNTFMPAYVLSCKIQIGQRTVTDNITMDMLYRHTQENVKNLQLNDSILGHKPYINYVQNGNYYSQSGFPFLLIDIQRLASENGEFGQFLANVDYPALQSINIEFTLRTMNANIGTNAINFYPFAYKFYPYSVAQTYDGKQINEVQIKISWDEARQLLGNIGSPHMSRHINLDLANGGAMFSGMSWISPVYNKVKDFLKKAIDGVRYAEDATKDVKSGPVRDINRALGLVSDASKLLTGYGNRAIKGGRRQLALL